MRTVGEIVDAVQEQQPATEKELRLALLCLYYNGQLNTRTDFAGKGQLVLELRAKEAFESRFHMLRAEPEKYLGERYTPGTEANADGRSMSKAILKAFDKQRGGP